MTSISILEILTQRSVAVQVQPITIKHELQVLSLYGIFPLNLGRGTQQQDTSEVR